MNIRKIAEDTLTVTLQWDDPPGSDAGTRYRLSDSLKVPHTWDAVRNTVHVSKAALPVKIEALGVVESGVWPPPAPGQGRVRTVFKTGSDTDALLNSFGAAEWAWANEHWDRMYVYPPYSDRWLGKMPKAWAYQDSYAIYNPSQYATEHPDQILKDAAGAKLYIPWGQRPDGSYPQYAADPGNAAWRQAYSDRVKAAAARGYGLYADDVNLDRVAVTGAPVDPRTGGAMLLANWQRYFAEMMRKVRADNPGVELVHNSLWWASGEWVAAQIKAADVFSLERGFLDGNYFKNPGQFEHLFSFVDELHSWGVSAYHLAYATSEQDALFNLCCALLCSDGTDFISGPLMQPSNWLSAYDADLGAEVEPRTNIGTYVWRRKFDGATVTVDVPNRRGTIQ